MMNNSIESEKKGWLLKWTNYIKGYQRRYFVLSDGVLSYYKNESEVNKCCRGKIKLASAVIKPLQNSNFLINKGVHDSFHLRAENETEKQKWLAALNLGQREASKNEDDYAESTCTETKSFEDELKDDLDCLFIKLQNIKACQEKLNKSGILLQKLLSDLDVLDLQEYFNESNNSAIGLNDNKKNLQNAQSLPHQDNAVRSKLIADILKSFKEKNGSYKIALNSTLDSCSQFTVLAQQCYPKLCKKLQKEHETNRNYEQVIDQLANHIRNVEEQIKKETNQLSSFSNEETDEKFYDAEEFSNSEHFTGLSNVPGIAHRVSANAGDLDSSLNSKRNSIKYEIKTKEPDQSTLNEINLDNQFKNNQMNDYVNYDQYTNESSDREDEPSLSSCNDDNDDDDDTNSRIDEMIKSSVVLVDNEQKESVSDSSFSRNSSSNDIVTKFSNEQNNGQSSQDSDPNRKKIVRIRRTRIPERPNQSLNLWSILKNSIGRDLSKIPMPVNFSEPLSLLQRVTGDFEYADLLHKAAKIKDPCEQLAYVAAFCVSNYATTGVRTCKPFNPLLFETYECDRLDDLGFRSIAEQVSHHPPMLALHCEAKNNQWILNSEFAISSKFRGKYLQVNPIDANHLEFPATNHHITFNKVTTLVHNIIVGKLWIDNQGDMIITNHTTGDKAHVKFSPYSYFSRDVPRKVTGVVLDIKGIPKFLLKGSWDEKIEISKILDLNIENTTQSDDQRIGRSVSKVIWKRNPFPPDSEKMYNLTKFAIELNEPEEGVAPTDSRFRPDQRLMEEGNWSEANRVKMLLEQKQRDARRQREELAEAEGIEPSEQQPIWFTKTYNELINTAVYRFNGDYWDKKKIQDWSKCPEIYL